MARYVDGFLVPVPTKKLAEYARISRKAGKIWREHGALEYKECAGDDLKIKGMGSFLRTMKAKTGETVVFAYIVYKSRRHRDAVNKKVMKDPRMDMMGSPDSMPFDVKRMLYGGFKVFVDV